MGQISFDLGLKIKRPFVRDLFCEGSRSVFVVLSSFHLYVEMLKESDTECFGHSGLWLAVGRCILAPGNTLYPDGTVAETDFHSVRWLLVSVQFGGFC